MSQLSQVVLNAMKGLEDYKKPIFWNVLPDVLPRPTTPRKVTLPELVAQAKHALTGGTAASIEANRKLQAIWEIASRAPKTDEIAEILSVISQSTQDV
ncbi:MAG: hypothetical protein P4L50_06010 [Anaerolineaceae bacterium]|nr:hypothetical protein [Anaerolineaceae bacterium]